MHGGLKDTLRVLRRKEVWTAYLRPPVHCWELDSTWSLPLGHNHSDHLDKMLFFKLAWAYTDTTRAALS